MLSAEYRRNKQRAKITGLVKDLPHTIQHHLEYIGGTVTPFFLVPLVGTYLYAENYVEREKARAGLGILLLNRT